MIKGEIEILQDQVCRWAHRNFPDETAAQASMGVSEELGELAEAHMALLNVVRANGKLAHTQLKSEQKIREMGERAKFELAAKDAVGDIIIFLAHYCGLVGISMQEAVDVTWNKVRQRDWNKDRVTGGDLDKKD